MKILNFVSSLSNIILYFIGILDTFAKKVAIFKVIPSKDKLRVHLCTAGAAQ